MQNYIKSCQGTDTFKEDKYAYLNKSIFNYYFFDKYI